jgi:hypothetical protein
MPGDFSRKTFVPAKRYSGVLMQQGRVQLDADWNEQWEIARHLSRLEARDVIGACGVPQSSDGFRVSAAPDSRDLLISAGRAYVDGLLCEWDASPMPVAIEAATSTLTPETLAVDGRAYAAGQWVRLSAPSVPAPRTFRIASVTANSIRLEGALAEFASATTGSLLRVNSYLQQPDLPNPAPPLTAGDFLVYLEAWQHEVNALDDPAIRESALGGPDTAIRLKTIAQVKLLPVAAGQTAPQCGGLFPEWNALTARPTGRLNARTQQTAAATPCQLPPTAGFTRLENQLYRVEVQRGGTRANATFKWSRDNAIVETAIEKIDGVNLTVADLGKDEALGFGPGQWVELLDPESEMKAAPRPLARIAGIDAGARVITLESPVATPAAKLRRWDQGGATATASGVAMPAGFVELESGVQVQFTEGSYRAGDYWLIPARTATGDIEWPGAPQPPAGVRHSFCRIATLRINADGQISLQDCRRLFPSLTELPGLDAGMRVTGVFGIAATGARTPLLNDSDVTTASIAGGIDVELDTPIAPESVSRPTAHVTLSRPLEASGSSAGFLDVMLASRLNVNANRIEWRLTNGSRATLDGLGQPAEGERGFLARLTLKGNRIWSRDNPNLFLDGDAFGLRPANSDGTRLRLPSGDSRAGGDFETWFWLRRATAAPFTLTAAAQPVTIRAAGLAELVGDIVITGAGGAPTAAGAPVTRVNIQVTTSLPLTSPLAGNFTDATLTIDDPRLLNTSGTFNPTSVVNGVGGAGLAFEQGQAPNIFQGQRVNANSVVFPGVPLDPGSAPRTLRIKNLRVAAALGANATTANNQVFAFVSIPSAATLNNAAGTPINNANVTVAFVQDELSTRVRLPNGQAGPFLFNGLVPLNPQMLDAPNPNEQAAPSFFLDYTEGFNSAFKVRKAGPTSLSQTLANQETGWDNDGPGAIPFAPGLPAVGSLGVANSGTLLQARFTNVPAGVRLFVTTRDVRTEDPDGPPRAVLTGGGAQAGLANGVPLREVVLVNGAGVVAWEWQSANAEPAPTTASFAIVVASAAQALGNNALAQQANVAATLAPLTASSAQSPIPRFDLRGAQSTPMFIRQIQRTTPLDRPFNPGGGVIVVDPIR